MKICRKCVIWTQFVHRMFTISGKKRLFVDTKMGQIFFKKWAIAQKKWAKCNLKIEKFKNLNRLGQKKWAIGQIFLKSGLKKIESVVLEF